MNTRKLAASLTAVVCSMGMLSYLPSFLAPCIRSGVGAQRL